METRLRYDTGEKHLSLAVKENVSTSRQVQLKFSGALNTVTGNFQYRGVITKNVFGPDFKFGPGAVAGVGIGVSSDTKDEPFATAFISQPVYPFSDKSYFVKLKGSVDYDIKGSGLAPRASVYGVKKLFNFTDRHDLRFKAGVDVALVDRTVKATPKLQVRENNWTLDWRRGKLSLFYDL